MIAIIYLAILIAVAWIAGRVVRAHVRAPVACGQNCQQGRNCPCRSEKGYMAELDTHSSTRQS
jgi:hypothetical protein